MKVISGLLPESWGYFCMKNLISTTRNCHSHIHESTHFILFALLKVHPRFFLSFGLWAPKLMGSGRSDVLGICINVNQYVNQNIHKQISDIPEHKQKLLLKIRSEGNNPTKMATTQC